jgi:hypothetical protein
MLSWLTCLPPLSGGGGGAYGQHRVTICIHAVDRTGTSGVILRLVLWSSPRVGRGHTRAS